jgi:hypothetical protein
MELTRTVALFGKAACPVQTPAHRLLVRGHVDAPHHPMERHFRPGLALLTELRNHALAYHGFAALVEYPGFQALHYDEVHCSFVSGLFLLCFPLSASWTLHPVDWAVTLYSAVVEIV